MKVVDVRVSGAEKGVYLRCSCRRLWREPLTADEARCPDCRCVGDLDSLIDAWAWTWPETGEG